LAGFGIREGHAEPINLLEDKMRRLLMSLVVCAMLAGLLVTPAMADWVDADGHKMHYPQHPDPNGWDVMCTFPRSLADDWDCSQTGFIKDFHFWGSWKDDNIGVVTGFIVMIHANNPVGPNGFSVPDVPIWGPFIIEDFVVQPVDPPSWQGWYDPASGEAIPNNHQQYFQYNIFLPEQMWFPQEQGTIYWLRISAIVADPQNTLWGWKSTQEHFMDDAVMAPWPDTPDGPWDEIFEPYIPPDPIINAFHLAIDPTGIFMDGFGDNAFPGGEQGSGWWYYPNSEWWNVWFYDHPLDHSRMKHFLVQGGLMPVQPGMDAYIEVAVNWSTDLWPPDGPPPVPGNFDPAMEDQFIGREIFYVFQGPFFDPVPLEYIYDLLPYNPEWVSIDIRGWNFMLDGVIEHTCLPQEPPVISLDLAWVVNGGPLTGVPTLSEWGMIFLFLLLMAAATAALIRRRKEVTA